MEGEVAPFAREGAIEFAWALVESVLVNQSPAHADASGTRGPPAANNVIAADSEWRNPDPR
jgi:glucose-6-phosphate 1-dehydrogenase